ncbi:MAG: saccharopine dehydrogenase NADP-binding domain-containing protein [Chitinophagaceae bacterium]|nr:saccharopine dehydrogenase NADP-binding domain-containing protein [Chitinophagaceae bacterium]
MKKICLFGAGKSATVLMDYLHELSATKGWVISIADQDMAQIQAKLPSGSPIIAQAINIHDADARAALISEHEVIISLMPPTLHALVAKDCLTLRKHLLTASYVDDGLRSMRDAIAEAGLLFLCEMGLDPGIDHMSAMQLIDGIHAQGGIINRFHSHCGGLVAPESDDNPWHYKISWNPRNVVNAGKAGAVYQADGAVVEKSYTALFAEAGSVHIPSIGELAYYPNRDSLSYMPLYRLEDCQDFLRTTLRYPAYCKGWNAIVQLQLADDQITYTFTQTTVRDFVQQHLLKHQLEWLWKDLLRDAELGLLLDYLGLMSDTIIPMQAGTAADVLQWLLETRLVLHPSDKDMIVMLHEIVYTLNGQHKQIQSSLVVKGTDALRTAMAKTVGLPLGIAAKLLIENTIQLRGLQIPTPPEIYTPVLAELDTMGICFQELRMNN